MAKTLFEILETTGLPCTYSHFQGDAGEVPFEPPYIVYIGSGQDNFNADNNFYWGYNRYQIEYYFTEKDESRDPERNRKDLGRHAPFRRRGCGDRGTYDE